MPRKADDSVPGADPDRGAAVLHRYPEITQEQAGRRTRAIYADIRGSLRSPAVPEVFRALANDLGFLETAWFSVGPYVRTRRFERDADRLRRRALLRPIPASEDLSTDLNEVRDVDRLRAFVDTVHYVVPKTLLCANLLDATLVRSQRRGARKPPEQDLPLGAPGDALDIRPVRVKRVRGARRELIDEIQSYHNHARLADFYGSLAQWPLVLEALWTLVKPTVGTGPYVDRGRSLAQDAFELSQKYPIRAIDEQTLGLEEDQIRELRDVISVYRLEILPDVLIDATLVKSVLDERAAVRSRFSVAREAPTRLPPRPRVARSRRRPVREFATGRQVRRRGRCKGQEEVSGWSRR